MSVRRSPSGQPGTWLLDPFDITIGTEKQNTSDNGSGTFTASGDPATVANTALQGALDNPGLTSVIVSTSGSGTASGDIRVLSPISWSSSSSLTLRADDNIAVKAAITETAGA